MIGGEKHMPAEYVKRMPTMGKRLSEIALLLAGTLLLVLSVVPHHHHGERICFGSEEQCPECHTECHGTHRHDEPQAGCDLRHLFVMSGRDDDSSRPTTGMGEDMLSLLLSATTPCLWAEIPSFVPAETGRFSYRPLRRSPETGSESTGISLRAPPFVAA